MLDTFKIITDKSKIIYTTEIQFKASIWFQNDILNYVLNTRFHTKGVSVNNILY